MKVFLRKHLIQRYCVDNFGISASTPVDWKRFWGEVCELWLEDQKTVGGPGVAVQVHESKFEKQKFNQGCAVDGV